MSGVTALSPLPRRVRPPSWLDLRLLLGIAMVLGAVVLGAVVVSRAQHTTPVVAATRDLAAGTVLTAAELTVVRVRLDDAASALYPGSTSALVGRQLARDVRGGELIPRAAAATSHAETTVTVPLPEGSAPPLHAGQRIEVWLSSPSCPSVVLLGDVTVQGVSSRDTGFSGGDGQDVVLRVAPGLAGRVVGALDLDQAHLHAGIVTGTAARETGANLPDLSGCAPQR
jgi:hypothetical protein